MTTTLISRTCTLDQLPGVVDQVRHLLTDGALLALRGSLGAGKTTLVSALLRAEGVTEPVTSPTFTYVNVYQTPAGRTFYHFDLYRLTSVDEFVAAGFDEYLGRPASVVLIEWPEVIAPLLDDQVFYLDLEYVSHDERRITLSRKSL